MTDRMTKESDALAEAWREFVIAVVNQPEFLWILRHLGMELKPKYRRVA